MSDCKSVSGYERYSRFKYQMASKDQSYYDRRRAVNQKCVRLNNVSGGRSGSEGGRRGVGVSQSNNPPRTLTECFVCCKL